MSLLRHARFAAEAFVGAAFAAGALTLAAAAGALVRVAMFRMPFDRAALFLGSTKTHVKS